MNSYELSRNFFDFCFENPERITPNHVALYFFVIEHCNRLGWKKNFGLPSGMAMEAIGIKSYNTYSKVFNDLVEFGFIIVVQKSKNQYSSNIVALSKIDKALDKALDKAITKHYTKQRESIDSIDKHINNKPITLEQETRPHEYPTLQDVITKGATIGVSEEICKAYFYNRDAVGWVNNKGHPIRKWNSDLMSFKLIYEQLNKNNQTEKINPNQKDGETYEQFIARVKRESQHIREIFQ